MDRIHSTISVLVVDDNPSEQSTLRRAFSKKRYHVSEAHTGRDALRHLDQYQVDVVILDSAIAEPTGWKTRSLIRLKSNVPIVMLISTAEEGHGRDWDLSPDEYVVKPIREQDVRTRVHHLLRRQHLDAVDRAQRETRTFDAGQLLVEVGRKEVRGGQRSEPLTATEFKLLLCLIDNSGVVLSNDEILQKVWESGFGGHRGNVKVHIRNLRRKLRSCVPEREYIVCRRGHGYMFIA